MLHSLCMFPIILMSLSLNDLDEAFPLPVPPQSISNPPLQVYTRCQIVDTGVPNSAAPPIAPLPPDPALPPSSTSSPPPISELDLPFAIRKGKHTCTSHLISNYVSYDHLSPSFSA